MFTYVNVANRINTANEANVGQCQQGRCQQDDTLTEQDFEYVGDGPDLVSLDLLFDDLIGCKSVKEKMAELKSTVEFSQAQGKAADACGISFNYLFLGNPG